MREPCVTYKDLDFDRALGWCLDHNGKPIRRWLPVGMPRIADNIEKTVFYLHRYLPMEDKFSSPKGTGFFVARHSEAAPFTYHIYAVSNAHVALKENQATCIRINTKEGVVRYLEYTADDWVKSETDDLAMVDVTEEIHFSTETGLVSDDISWVSEVHFATSRFNGVYNVGIGDQTLMLGLYEQHSNSALNVPVARFGNVAAIPSDQNPVKLGSGDIYSRPAYLNDMRSRAGFSGSPVWVWRTPNDDMNQHWGHGFFPRLSSLKDPFLALIGVHRGQFPDRVLVEITGHKDLVRAEIPSSMTVVIPADRIVELMYSPRFTQAAADRDKDPDRIKYSEQVMAIMRAQESRRGSNPSPIDDGGVPFG